jgi:hypothetical protein
MTIFVLAVAIKTRFYFPNKRKDYEKENIFNQNKEIKEQSYVMTIKINTIIKKFFGTSRYNTPNSLSNYRIKRRNKLKISSTH